jgi:hypothetical protein
MTITEHDAGLRAFPVVERRTLAKDDRQASRVTLRSLLQLVRGGSPHASSDRLSFATRAEAPRSPSS